MAQREWALVRDATSANAQAPSIVRVGDPLHRAVEAILARPHGRNAYVLDSMERLVGVVSFRSLVKATEARLAGPTGGLAFFGAIRELMADKVEDVMRSPVTIREETPLVEALRLLRESGQADLPIVDEGDRLLGELNGLQVLEASLRVLETSAKSVEEARTDGEPTKHRR